MMVDLNSEIFAEISFDIIDADGDCKNVMKTLARAGYLLINISTHRPNPTYLIAKTEYQQKCGNCKYYKNASCSMWNANEISCNDYCSRWEKKYEID